MLHKHTEALMQGEGFKLVQRESVQATVSECRNKDLSRSKANSQAYIVNLNARQRT